MTRNMLFTIVLFFVTQVMLPAQSTSLSGYVKKEETGVFLSNTIVALYQKGRLVKETKTNSLGYYQLDNLKPGTYAIEANCSKCSMKRFENVPLFAGKAIKLDIELLNESIWIDAVTVISYKIPDIITPIIGCSLTSDIINKIPVLKMSVMPNPPASQHSLDALVVQQTVGCSVGGYKKEPTAVYSLTASQIRLSRIKMIVKNLSR